MKEKFRVQGPGSILPCSWWMVDGGWWKQQITCTGKRSGSATVLLPNGPTDPPPSTLHLPPVTQNSSHGFTLIEVTLATVVIGMGLLAVFGLGQLALRNAKATEDDTRAAMLADGVFASLRAVSENLCASNNPDAWTKFWTDFANGNANLPGFSVSASFSNQFDNAVWGDRRTNTLNLFSLPQIHNAGLPPMPEWSARYWMLVENVPAASDTNIFKVTLNIAPGASGAIGESRQFFTLFAEHGTLP